MTANAEARALLDQLMGVERDALLPAGAALPRKSKRPLGDSGGGMILPGAKRSKSCYDRDIDPLYCAWGIDVYELFVNTKSDIGPNPYTVDEEARKEYSSLPRDDKERLGFESRLFVKLQELVQHCDRTVHRNHEKLKRELQRQSQKRGGNDYVVDVSEEKVEELVRAECQVEDMKEDLLEALVLLNEVRLKEEGVLEEQRREQQKQKQSDEDETTKNKDGEEPSDKGKGTSDNGDKNTDEAMAIKLEDTSEEAAVVIDREGKDHNKVGVKVEPQEEGPAAADPDANENNNGGEDEDETEKESGNKNDAIDDSAAPANSAAVIEELGKLALKKQKLLCQIATIITQLGPLEESISIQHMKLNFVRSDTTTDKTVCEVSGNFMSARDADERIAAHYAGKQYVGWKLVRDKYQQMVQKHGKYGPPRPHGGGGRGGGGPLLMSHQKYQQMQQGGGGGSYGDRDRYNGNNSRGRGDDRRSHGRGADSGRWERGGGYGDRGGGGYRGGGGHDDRRRGGGGYGDRDRGGGYRGGGGYGRR